MGRVRVLVGVDVQPIDEIATSLEQFGARYTSLLFTPHELDYSGHDPATSASRLAGRFAAKEATLKVLRIPTDGHVIPRWTSIEVRHTTEGWPELVLNDEAAEIGRSRGIEHMELSISHAGGIATAVVVAEVGGS